MSSKLLALKTGHESFRQMHEVAEEYARIMYGFGQFQSNIAREVELVKRTQCALEKLGEKSNQFQLSELADAKRELEALAGAASELVDALQSEMGQASGESAKSVIVRIWNRIGQLLDRERQRRFSNLRVQGKLVERSEPISGTDCQGQHAEAVLRFIDELNRITADPASKLQGLWRFFTLDDSIWLYQHDPVRKWQCLFFRVDITRLGNTIDFVLESYVPLGFGDDPTPYKLDKSEAYIRPDWKVVEMATWTFNAGNTMNLNVTDTKSFGTTLGRSVSVSTSSTDTSSTTESDSEAFTESTGTGSNTGWAESLGTSVGGSHTSGWTTGGMSMGSSNSSNTRNWGKSFQNTRSGGTTLNESTSITGTKGTGIMQGTSIQSGSSNTQNIGETNSISNAVSKGYAATRGEALQVSVMSFGVDSSVSTKQQLELWKSTNADASKIYDRVQAAFKIVARQVIRDLSNSIGSGEIDTRGIHERYADLEAHILIEPEMLASEKIDRTLASPKPGKPVKALTQANGVVISSAAEARRICGEPFQPDLSSSPSLEARQLPSGAE